MDFYWLYDLSNVQLFFLVVGFITISGLSKTLLFPDFFENFTRSGYKDNEFIIGFLSLTGAFLSITIGLIIVGTYESFEQAEDTVRQEVSELHALYKNIQLLDDDNSNKHSKLLESLEAYSKYVIETEWPKQQKGIPLTFHNPPLDIFEHELRAYTPSTQKDFIVYRELLSNYQKFIKLREYRLSIIQDGLPMSIYTVLIFGLLINILISWKIYIDNIRLEIIVYTLTGLLAGTLVYIIIAMDYPFRGKFSVEPEAFEMFLESIKDR